MAVEPTDPERRRETTPLPKLQTTVALLIAHAEPVTGQVIYPFIPAFVRRTGVTGGDEKSTGYYAGIIESLFFVTECLTVYHWGRASDRIGRRPILLIGPLGLTVAMLGFGLSKTFWQLVVFRCAQGVFNGNLGVVKTLMVEFTDDTNLADALTLLTLAWNVGSTIGPAMGGILSDPAEQWPRTFRHPFFRENPYFLACAAAAMCAFTAFIFAFHFLKETLNTSPSSDGPSERDPLLAGSNEENQNKAQLTIYEIVVPNLPLQRSLITLAIFSLTHMSYRVLIPLVYSTSIPSGGLGLSPYQIGIVLGIYGVCNGILQLFVWKPMLKRIGPKKMFILSYSFHTLRMLMMTLARVVAARVGSANWLVWTFIVAQMGASTLAATAYNAITTLIVKSAPPNALGAVNGIQQMISSGLRGLAPIVASSLFAVSLALDWKVSGGSGGVCRYFVDILTIGLIIFGVWYSRRLPSYRLI
ncbi:hypothetical protein E1B28_011766 [Marasmius oreades]|uniref:Major facilitator superfamily (MFS) profile domain-containing protein n=1 Tax=Marasmius oreades TaxID=181124 RepID=A0A9P7RVF6_9AGAR|nr:uncharacterized protein E1B28_011766 [Marasmius oreades]KAG7090157.1 hypothetical protein E1B28_011766 [Marasmius oreades]